ncbi:MAG: hypothetical protein ACR2MT_11760 [Aurantibacter sp.]
MKNIVLILILFIASCSPKTKSGIVSDEDLKSIHELHKNYRDYWLENDSMKVINLFDKNGALIPPNNSGNFVHGKKAIGEWWFTVIDDTTYPITGFEYSSDSLIVIDSNTAIWEGVSTISWQTVVKDSVISSTQSSSNFITICTKVDEEWKILRQIWNVRPDK